MRPTTEVTVDYLKSRSLVNPITDCWDWQGTITSWGYGHIYTKGRTHRVHRLIYQLSTGKTVDRNTYICHTCDNTKCCNPSHLFEGTPKDNMHDKMKKGRSKLYSKFNGERKLSIHQVEEIKKLYIPFKFPQRKLAKIYGVSQRTITKIVNNIELKKESDYE